MNINFNRIEKKSLSLKIIYYLIITIEWLEPRLIFKFHQIKIFILKPKSISTILKYINIHSLSNINFNRILLFTV